MEMIIGIGFLLFVIIVCAGSVFGTATQMRTYKKNLRRLINSYFSKEWKNGEEVCAAILWNQNDTVSKGNLISEIEQMVREGLLEFRPKQGSGSLMGEYRLV